MTRHRGSEEVLSRTLPYGKQCIEEDDRRAVLEVLDSDWLTQGPVVDEFETKLAAYFGTSHAVACANGTAALHLAALGLGWTKGDVVIVPAITFLASANCCAYVGADPYFVDIDPQSYTIDPNEVEKHVRLLLGAGKRVRGIVGVDLAGLACDWPSLRTIADRYDLTLVDDACHALGGTYANGVKVGSCKDNDLTILSFHPVKHITTGEGGAILTNDAELAAKLRSLRSHGTTRGEANVPGWEGPWHYDMTELGFNYRLTDLQAALGVSQLRKVDRFLARRRAIAAWYDELLSDSIFQRPVTTPGTEHAYHLYILRAPFAEPGVITRRTFFERCLDGRVQLQVHYRPIPLNSYYAQQPQHSSAVSRIPVSMRFYREAFSVPMFPELQHEEVENVVRVLERSLERD